MPFGLHSASATFHWVLDRVIGPKMSPHAFVYQEDIIVIGRSLEEHMTNLKEVFRWLKEVNLRLSPEKCQFFKKELLYLGHRVISEGSHRRTRTTIDSKRAPTVLGRSIMVPPVCT